MARKDKRALDELRPIAFERRFTRAPAGSVLARCGRTTVLCTASIQETVPAFLTGTGRGWVTAGYEMLPGSTAPRKNADPGRGPDGRSQEIKRMVGRVLRSVVNLDLLGETTLYLDCHVLEADGGTRTTAVNGSYVALVDALRVLQRRRNLKGWWPLQCGVAATSVGLVEGEARLDLNYEEDSRAEADMNVAMSHAGGYVEVQATGERRPVDPEDFRDLLELAGKGIREVAQRQQKALDA